MTVAARAAMTMAGWCEPGDVMGVIGGDFVLIGDDALDVAAGVLTRLLAGGGELVTLVAGEDAGDLVARTAEWLDREHPLIDVVTYDGGQPRYPLLLSVE